MQEEKFLMSFGWKLSRPIFHAGWKRRKPAERLASLSIMGEN